MKHPIDPPRPRDDEALHNIQVLKDAAYHLLTLADDTIPDCREKSVARTHIETAAMWLTRGVLATQDGMARRKTMKPCPQQCYPHADGTVEHYTDCTKAPRPDAIEKVDA